MLRVRGIFTLVSFVVCAAATPAALAAAQPLVWHDPGDVSKLDFGGDVGTGIPAPKPPFRFLKEDGSGTQPKILVEDANHRTWDVKFGNEVRTECFAWRIPAAVGYFVEPSYYVASGQIAGLGTLNRKTPSIGAQGQFREGRFQIRDAARWDYIEGRTWTWKRNPFAGTPELKGLEILIMLASNWDNKDGSAGPGEANVGMFRRTANGREQLLYSFTDWGSGMGAWGDKTGQTDWRCKDYAAQTPQFVKGVANGYVVFGYEGHMRDGFQTGIRPSDVAWLMKYLGQLTDAQLRAGIRAAGGSASDETCFTAAIRARIEQLRRAAR